VKVPPTSNPTRYGIYCSGAREARAAEGGLT
jgi:hypothetical protein